MPEFPYHAPVLLCGYFKSGTTLLLSLLSGHPDLLAFPMETNFLRCIARKKRRQTADYAFQNLRWVQQVFREKCLGDHCDLDRYERRLRELLDGRLATSDVMHAYMLAYAEASGQSGKRRWVEKTPENELHLESAFRLWPDLQAVRIVRDPRDCFASYRIKCQRRGVQLTAGAFMKAWKKGQSCWDRFARRRPERCLLVQFEHLTTDAELVMRQVSQFLNIPFHESLLRPTMADQPWAGNSMHDETFTSVSSRPIGRYSQLLAPAEVAAIERGLGECFPRFGWKRESAGVRQPFFRRAA